LLLRYRIEAGMTQATLAERADISARAIQRLERWDLVSLRLRRRCTLADALQLETDVHANFQAAASPAPRPRRSEREADHRSNAASKDAIVRHAQHASAETV
jgi:transcriptional regulator with XRE-family HTH domain